MKIKLKNYARQLWLSLLLLVGVAAIAVPGLNGTNGTNEADLTISSVVELKAFRDAVNSGASYAGKTVKLTANLDLSGETNWTPIGNLVAYPGQSFDGTFDGDGHTISNLTVNDNTPKYAVAGLFGSVVNGTIKNLTVKNVNITSTYYAGGIVAYTANAPTIENCHVIGGTINTTPEKLDDGKYDNGCKAGGIMGGYAPKGTTINNCTVEDVTITGYRDIGGIVGYSGGTITNNTVKNVTVTQDLTNAYEGTPNTIGDIIGRSSGATLSNNKVIKSIVKVTDNAGNGAEYGDMKDAFDAINADPKESYTITLLKDATYTDAEQYRHAALAEGNTVTKNVIIDGAGHTLTFVGGGVRGFYTESTAAEKVTFQNMTIADNTRYDAEKGNDAWEFAYLEMGEAKTCPLEFTNVKFADGISVDGTKTTFTDCEFIADGNAKRSTQTAEHCMWISNGEVIVNNCTFTGYRAIKLHEAYGTEIGSVVIDGCTFKDLSVKPAVVIGDLNAATSVTITNNTIEGVQKGDQEMYLYESDTDLANFTNNLSGNTFNAKNEAELTVALNSGMFNKAVLQGDIALTKNVTCGLEEGTFTLVQGEKTLTAGDHSIALNPGVTIVTDKQTDIFSAADANFKVVETAVEDGYTYTVVAKEYVAQIGDEQKYYSLAEAFEAATDGQTITVLTDIDLPSTIAVTKQVTLDLDGKKIFNTSDLWVGSNWSFFSVQAGGNLTVTGNGTIDAKENDCYTFDVRDGGILTIKNGTFTGNISCVYLINEAGTGVSTCNIEGGRFSIKQLANNVQDDKYRYLLNCHDASYAGNMAKFNVTGGSFVKFNPANNLAEGTETNFCAAGYEAVQDGEVWRVQKAAVAKIGETKYYSLADAFEAAEANDIIELIADAPVEGTGTVITVDKVLTLDLKGHKVINNATGGRPFTIATGGNLTIDGTTEGSGFEIPSENTNSYGFFRIDGEESVLTVNGGSFTGNTDNGAFFRVGDNTGATVNLNNLSAETNYRFVACGNYTWSELNVTGGTYTHNNKEVRSNGGVVPAFYLAGFESVFDGVTITSQIGSCVDVAGYKPYTKATFRNNTFKVEETSADQPWNNVAIAVDTNGEVIVESGTYEGSRYGLYIFTSGGDVTINGGTFKGATASIKSDFDDNSYGKYEWSSKATITDGFFNGPLSTNNSENATISVSGGVFTVPVSEQYCADGYISVDNLDEASMEEYPYTVRQDNFVAQIEGGDKYETLDAAFAAAETGATVKVLTDITLDKAATLPVGKTVSLDLNGKTISAATSTIRNMGNLTVVDNAGNGKIVSTGNFAISVGNNSTTTISNAESKDFAIESVEGAIITGTVTGATININGGTLSASDNAVVAGNGSAGYGGNTINITGGTFNGGITSAGYVACGIYAPNNDVWNITGGTFNITGGAGVVQRAGTVNISDDVVFNVTGSATGKVGDSRVVVPCAAIVFDSEAAYPGMTDAASMNISGGTFIAESAAVAYVAAEGAASHIAISGGKFSSKVPEECCAPNYVPTTEPEDGYYTVQTKEDAGVFELRDWEVYPYLSYTEDKEAASVTYIRRFGNTNWQALYIPFDINDISELTDKYEFAKIHMVALENDGQWTTGDKIEVYYTKMTEGKIHANKPYLIKPKNTGEQSIVVENTILHDTHNVNPMQTETTAAVYAFTGTYVGVDATSSNTFFAMGSGTINFCDNVHLGAYRWYLNFEPKSDDYAKPIIDFIESDSDATGVSSVKTGDDSDIEGYYNINGVRSETPVRGVNIIRYKNGSTKKVVIK